MAFVAALTIAIAYLVAESVARVTQAIFAAIEDQERPGRFTDAIQRRSVRLTRAVVFGVVLAALALPAFELAGLRESTTARLPALMDWLYGSGLRVLVIALLAYLVVRIVAFATARLESSIQEVKEAGGVDELEIAKRAHTVGRLVRNAVTALVTSIALLMVLREIGVDIMPVLTGAGILGLAVGFGAQTLVRDVISGFFLIVENNLRVGDVAVINGTGGIVEAINLRTTVTRDVEGTLHVFPNGSFERFSNRTKDFSFYVVDLGVAYKEDTDRVCEVLREVGDGLQRDPRFAASILAPLEIMGVDAFAESQVTIKLRIKTVPLKQWEVGRELRRRIKQAFDQAGIEIPFPHVSVYFGEASRPWRVEQTGAAGPRAVPTRSAASHPGGES
jgi:small conductance mechanosensitive channel